jgi:uncharacterized small protein (DUF1192 family)
LAQKLERIRREGITTTIRCCAVEPFVIFAKMSIEGVKTMHEKDDGPTKKVSHEIGQDLSLLSAFELRERIALLQAEIQRLDATVTAKEKAKGTADSFFRL